MRLLIPVKRRGSHRVLAPRLACEGTWCEPWSHRETLGTNTRTRGMDAGMQL